MVNMPPEIAVMFRNLSDFNSDIICDAIQNGRIKLHEVVEGIGPFLTSTDLSERQQATQLLADLLPTLPLDFLTTKEVQFVIDFWCDRLQDHPSIIPHVLHGILTLVQCHNFPDGKAEKIITTILKEVHVPSQLYEDRYTVYNIFSILLQTRLKEIQVIGPEFVYGFIQILDGEKNPRCLMMAFSIIPFLVCNTDLGTFAEDLFEVIACYFPVDFTPRASDPAGINRENLAKALESCLASTDKFAKYFLPLLLEKLDSDLAVAHWDSWNALSVCSRTYSPESLKPFLSSLWEAARKEIFLGKSDKNETASLAALTALVRMVSSSKEIEFSDPLEDFIKEILTECKHHLSDPKEHYMYQASKILQAVAIASHQTCFKVLSFVFPFLLEQFSVQPTKQKIILELLATFIELLKELDRSYKDSLQNYQESILSLFFSVLSLNEKELKLMGLRGLLISISVPHMLKNEHYNLLSHHLLHLTLSDTDSKLRTEIQGLLTNLVLVCPDVVNEQVIPSLLSKLSSLIGVQDEIQLYNHVLEALAATSSHIATLNKIITPLLDVLKTLFTSEIADSDAFYSVAITKCMLSIIKNHLDTLHPPVKVLFYQCALPLLKLCLQQTELQLKPLTTKELVSVEAFCQVIQAVVPILDVSAGSSVINEVVSSYCHAVCVSGMEPSLTNCNSALIKIPDDHLLVFLLVLRSSAAGMPLEVPIPKLGKLFNVLLSTSINNSENLRVTEVAAHCLTITVFRVEKDSEVSELVQAASLFLKDIIDSNIDPPQRERALLVWIWLTKSLVIQGHRMKNYFIEKLVFCLQDGQLGRSAAEGFLIIVQDSPEILHPKNCTKVKFLYRQRFFLETSPKLLHEYSISPDSQKANYLVALCYQLKYIPKPVLLSELHSLLPLLVHSLHQKNPDILFSTLTTLSDLFKSSSSSELLEDYIQTLVPNLLHLSISKQHSMKIRQLSLQNLGFMTSLSDHLLIPHRQEVIHKLGACLEDNKRLIRKSAVESRCQWYFIGQPGR